MHLAIPMAVQHQDRLRSHLLHKEADTLLEAGDGYRIDAPTRLILVQGASWEDARKLVGKM